MPEWLLNKDEYTPPKEKDAFINKSILGVLGVITKFKLNLEYKPNKFGINITMKIISALLFVLMISLSRNMAFLLVTGVFLLLIVSLLDVEEIRYIIKMGAAVGIFTFIILIPSIVMGNKNNSIMIVVKVLETVSTVAITSCTTRWSEITGVLKMFKLPDVFVFILDITIKYVLILGEFSLNMLYALRLRSVGSNKSKHASLSGIIGTMFLKSKEMAEEMQGAMECRGFNGEYKVSSKSSFKINDFLCILIDLSVVLIYFYFDRL